MIPKITFPEFQEIIENKDWRTIKSRLSELSSQDIAELLSFLDTKEAILVFRLVSYQKATEIFSDLEPSLQEFILTHFADKEIKQIIQELSYDDRTALFEDLPGKLTQKLLNFLDKKDRVEALKLLGYPEDSVGRLMTPDYVVVRPEWSIQKSFEHIRKYGKDAETINMIYVVDKNWKLLDDIPIRRFILFEQDEQVRDMMDFSFVSISAIEDQEDAYKLFKKYDLTVLPVIDKEGVLLGIVTVDDIFDVREEEVTEDFHKTSAISPVEESYYTVSASRLYRKRIGWLLILLLTDFFSSSIIAHFENAIQAVIALAFFIPILIDSGGNISAQSSTLIIRALATGELTIRSWFKVVKKELLIGLMIGLTLGSILYIRGFFWRGGPTIGMVVGISMVAITVWANLLGSILPIILTKLKLDPAVISSPLLTTLIDSTGLIIYFSLAKFVLHLE
ncbi:MAG: magnesium transporter [Bacteroidetes bacterium]|nr:MAG: magnesium transporter [Bacteroidota bacterium]